MTLRIVGWFFVSVSLGLQGQELKEGRYPGFFSDLRFSGEFELGSEEQGEIRGVFRVTDKHRGAGEPWEMPVTLREDIEGASYTIEFPENPRTGANSVQLLRFDTPYGGAYVGSFSFLENGSLWTGYVVLWLDQALSPKAFGDKSGPVPKLRVDSAGRFRLWTADPGGLTNNATRCMLKTSDGYLWVGTVDGLSRFDGRTWKNYFFETAPSLPGWNFRGLAEDNSGNVIALVKHHGLFRLQGGIWNPFQCNEELKDRHLSGLMRDQSGSFWFSIDSTLLARVDAQERLMTWKMADLLPLWRSDDFRPPRVGGSVSYRDSIVFATSRGPRVFGTVFGDNPSWMEPRVADGVSIVAGPSGDLWVSSLSVAYHYDVNGRVVDVFQPREFSGTIRATFPRRKGGLWVIGGNGLFLMPNSREIIHYSSLPVSMTSAVTAALEDDEGSIWIATGGSGLCQFQPSFFESLDLEEILTVPGYDRTRPVSLATDSSGEIMFAMGRGVSRRKGSEWLTIEGPSGLVLQTVVAETGDHDSSWWSGILPHDDYRVNAERGFESVPIPISFRYSKRGVEPYYLSSHPLGLPNLSCMIWVEESGAWLGTREGIWICNNGNVENWNDQVGLPRFGISSLLQDAEGMVWVGTSRNGLYGWNSKTREVNHYSAAHDAPGADAIVALAESKNPGLWISRYQGLFWNPFSGSREPVDFTGDLNLPVQAIVEDLNGNIWAGTSTGIYALRSEIVEQLQSGQIDMPRWLRFSRSDGLSTSSVELGQFPLAKTASDGRVYFCMQGDLVAFKPEELLGTVSDGPRIRLTHLSDEEKVLWRNNGEAFEPAPLRLAPGSGTHLEVGFSAIHFADPELVKFRYRIPIISQNWNELGAQQSVWLFDLAPGDYVFEVEAIDRNLVQSPNRAVLSFHIQPYFYQTLTFKFGLVLGLVALVWGIHYRRVRNQLRLQAMDSQLRLEADRRRIAHDMHDEIGASFAQLKILCELAESRRIEGRVLDESVSRMVSLARSGSQTLREILWALEPSDLAGEDLGEFLGITIDNLCDGTGIQVHYRHAWTEPTPNLSPRFKREVILITKGVVSNVIRHSQAQNFRCDLLGEKSTLKLKFIDDGIGFDPSKLRGDSLGMQSLRDRVERWGGSFSLSTFPGKGVKIDISLVSDLGD